MTDVHEDLRGTTTRPPSEQPASHRAAKKRWLRVGLALPVLLAALLGVQMVSTIMSTIVSDQETDDIFSNAAELPPELIDSVRWLPDTSPTRRPMEPLTRLDIASSWIRAWEQVRIVAETGDTSGVEVYFANSARVGVLERADAWGGRSVRQLGHDLELTFYSEDGSIVGITAVESRLLRSNTLENGSRIENEVTESYDAVLVLEDGNWRVHHWVRRSISS